MNDAHIAALAVEYGAEIVSFDRPSGGSPACGWWFRERLGPARRRAIIGGVMQRFLTALGCVGTGVLLAAALPPWGWWPLAFVGVALLDRLVADRTGGRGSGGGHWWALGCTCPRSPGWSS